MCVTSKLEQPIYPWGVRVDGASPEKFDQIFDPGCLCLEAGTQILHFKWLHGFFFGWFHLARFWEIWIASVLNTWKDGFGDNIEIIFVEQTKPSENIHWS